MKNLFSFIFLLISVCAFAQEDKKPAIADIHKINSLNKPLIVLDGAKKGVDFDLQEIDPNDISRIEILKGDSARFYYGEAGKNGVIVVTSKLQSKTITPAATKTVSINEALWIVEGVKKDKEFVNTINPDEIESISILKDANATALYGDAGKNGVIIVSLKK